MLETRYWLVVESNHLKKSRSKMDHFPNFRGENNKNIYKYLKLALRIADSLFSSTTSDLVVHVTLLSFVQPLPVHVPHRWIKSRGHHAPPVAPPWPPCFNWR